MRSQVLRPGAWTLEALQSIHAAEPGLQLSLGAEARPAIEASAMWLL
jgi:hypothetical protein